jgi:nucleoside permease NupC
MSSNSSGIHFVFSGIADVQMFSDWSMVRACTQLLFIHIFSAFSSLIAYTQSLCQKGLQHNLWLARLAKGRVYLLVT